MGLNSNISNQFKKIFSLFSSKNFNEAEQLALKVIKKLDNSSPNNLSLLFNILGAINNHKKKFNKAILYYKKAIKLNKHQYDYYYNLAISYKGNLEFNKAIKCYDKAIKLKPNYAEAYNNKGNILKELGKFSESLDCYTKAINFKPDYAEAYNNKGNILKELGKFRESLDCYTKAINFKPDYAEAYNNKGNILKDIGKLDESLNCYREAIKINSQYLNAHNNLGNLFVELGKLTESIASFDYAIKIDPYFIVSFVNKIKAYEAFNKVKEAKKILLVARNLKIENIDLDIIDSKICIREKKYQIGKKILIPMSKKINKLNLNQKIEIFFLLGKIYDYLEDYKKSYLSFVESNKYSMISFQSLQIDQNKYLNSIKNIKKSYTENITKKLEIENIKDNDLKYPIFLFGFPRSGTTLLHVILNNHPDIEVIEEQPIVTNVITKFEDILGKYPKNFNKLNSKNIKLFEKIYLNEIDKYRKNKNKKLYIDKLPLNFVHIALINRIFPKSKIIFAVRHPCDVILSCFMQNFVPNEAMINFYNLKDATKLYIHVMSVWKKAIQFLNLNVHYVRYENVVSNINSETKKLSSFLNIPWSNSMINYHEKIKKSANKIKTPSYNQVSEKIYLKSKFRWKNYSKYFSPIINELKPWIKFWKYEN